MCVLSKRALRKKVQHHETADKDRNLVVNNPLRRKHASLDSPFERQETLPLSAVSNFRKSSSVFCAKKKFIAELR